LSYHDIFHAVAEAPTSFGTNPRRKTEAAGRPDKPIRPERRQDNELIDPGLLDRQGLPGSREAAVAGVFGQEPAEIAGPFRLVRRSGCANAAHRNRPSAQPAAIPTARGAAWLRPEELWSGHLAAALEADEVLVADEPQPLEAVHVIVAFVFAGHLAGLGLAMWTWWRYLPAAMKAAMSLVSSQSCARNRP